MAYTYKDFVNAANNAGLMGDFSQDDLNRAEKNPEYGMGMLSIKKDYQSANDEQRILLDEAANQLRKSYELPSTPVAQEALNGAPGFKYDRQDEYKQLLDDTISHGSFEWDVDKDPRWGAYKKNYLREGERAQANALAQASATSGGRASSYAATAAAQAGNYYASALSDVIPKLYNDAYGQYRDDFNLKLSQLEAMRKDKADKYNIYVDTLNDAWRKKQAEEAAKQQKFQNAMALYRQFGYAPNQEVADILGVPYGPPQRSSGGGGYYGGGYSGGGHSDGDSGGYTDAQAKEVRDYIEYYNNEYARQNPAAVQNSKVIYKHGRPNHIISKF